MEYPINYQQEELVGQSFNLGEIGGGSQLIIFDEAISAQQHHVITAGNAPQTQREQLQQPAADGERKSIGRIMLEKVSHYLPQINKASQSDENQKEDNDTELRCFRLTFQDEVNLLDGKFKCEEFVDPNMIVDFAGKLLDSLHPDRTM